MKKRFATFLVGLSLVAPVLSGCGSSNGNNPFNPGGDGGNIANYTGSNTKVGTIQNMPVSAYKQTTKDAIYHMYDVFSGRYTSSSQKENADMMMDYMLALGVGDNLATAFAEAGIKWYQFGVNGSFDAKEFNTACYDVLKILNSFDYSKVANVLEKINKDYDNSEKEWARNRLNSISLESYVNPRIGNMYYSNYKDLAYHKSAIKSSELNSIVNEYGNYFNSYSYSSGDRSRYNEYVQSLQEEVNRTYEVIPSEIISFVKKQAKNIKSVVVNDLKLVVDAYGELIANYIEQFFADREGSDYIEGESRAYVRHEQYTWNGGYYTLYDSAAVSSSSNTMMSVIKTLAQNKQVTLGLLKSILTDSKLAEIALDFALTFVIPTLKKTYSGNQNALDQIEKLRQRVSALSSGHIASIANLALNILNQVSVEDYETLMYLFVYVSDESSSSMMEQLLALGDKYAPKFEKVLSSLSGKDKSNILAIGQIFGIDIVAQLQELLRIYNNKNLNTQEGYELFQTSIYLWYKNISVAFSANFSFLWNDDYNGNSGSSKPQSDPKSVYKSIGGGYYLYAFLDTNPYGKTQSLLLNNVYIQINDSYGDYLVYDDYEYLKSSISYVNSYGSYQASERFGSERAALYEYLSNSNFSLSVNVNTNSIGTVPYSVFVLINNNTYTFEGDIQSTPTSVTYIENSGINGNYYYYSCDNGYSHPAVEKNKTIYNNYGTQIDTSTEGWNVFYDTNYRAFTIYYVFNPSKYQVTITEYEKEIGIYVVGENDFRESPYVWCRYTYNGLGISYSDSDGLSFDYSYVNNKTPGKKYSVTVDGFEFEYVIVSKPSQPVSTSYRFYLDDVNYYDEITKPTEKTATLYAYMTYAVVVDDRVITFQEEIDGVDVRLTNLTYDHYNLKFTYAGKSYSFVDW